MNKELEQKVDEDIKRIMAENGMKEDMLGYRKLYEEIKRKLVFEKYNIILEQIPQNNEIID